MLDSFYIKNFRLFKELKIKTLSRINLITGKNNSGKSCFLEALRVYATDASPLTLYNLVEERGQNWESDRTSFDNFSLEIFYRHLFYGYKFPEINKECLEIGSFNKKENNIKLQLAQYQLIKSENGSTFSRLENCSENINITNPIYLVIEIEQYSKRKPLVALNRETSEYIKSYKLEVFKEKSKNIQFIPTRHLNDDVMSFLWDSINVKPNLRSEIFNALRLIDPKIQEIVIIGRSTPIIIYNNETQIPLQSLGDGAIHLFHIILALVNAKDGILLIDEFENGLHYSVQPKIWNVIFKLAETLNIQVFATTHSRDCIRSFHEIWSKPENNDKGCFFRLDHYPEKDIIRPMFYDIEILGDALDVNGEMR